MKKKIAQSVLEYLGVSAVFAGVGIGTFLAVNQATVFNLRGTEANYESTDTLLGKTIDSEAQWPEGLEEPKVDEPRLDEPRLDEPRLDEPRLDEPRVENRRSRII